MEEVQDSKRTNSRSGVQDGDSDDGSGCGSCIGGVIYVFSMILIIVTFPFSLCVCVRMVQVIIVSMQVL